MKSLLLIASLLFVSLAYSQSKECDFPKSWKVDPSRLIATQVVKDDSGKRESDTLDISMYNGKYELPDSAVFNDDKVLLFFGDEKARVVEGSYKLSNKKFSFKAKQASLASVKYKFKRDNASCSLVKDGIYLTTIIKEDEEKYILIRYYLIPDS
ncbi:hypothetical protein AAOE16_11620 [Ekhidna sp. MALMAid0563]|uniref:hypothetical protein n=1 Tax=Ekhidna sp. MALMAid0563 TaxID=3143937 RepID=UPI0032E00577